MISTLIVRTFHLVDKNYFGKKQRIFYFFFFTRSHLSLFDRTINYADFHWVIKNDVKTNTRQTCTYDRVFVNGDDFVNAIVPDSANIANFQEKFGMTLEEALKVSDHMPVKFDIEW